MKVSAIDNSTTFGKTQVTLGAIKRASERLMREGVSKPTEAQEKAYAQGCMLVETTYMGKKYSRMIPFEKIKESFAKAMAKVVAKS